MEQILCVFDIFVRLVLRGNLQGGQSRNLLCLPTNFAAEIRCTRLLFTQFDREERNCKRVDHAMVFKFCDQCAFTDTCRRFRSGAPNLLKVEELSDA